MDRHHFATPSDLADLGVDHQQLLIAREGRHSVPPDENTPPAIFRLAQGITVQFNQIFGSSYQFSGNTELRGTY